MTARDKFIVVALLGLLVVVSVVAILDEGTDQPRDPGYGGTYVEGVVGVPQYLNPLIAATDVDEDVVRLAFSGLTRYDQSGAIVPDLAASFRTESDGKVWNFEIRDDATWQDGHPIGSGPFRVIDVDSRQVTLSRNDSFYRTRPARNRPYLDRVILRFYPDPSEALLALARGELDGIGGLSSQDAERARSLKNAVLYSLPTHNFVALFLNLRPEKTVFRDRGRILQLAADGRGTVADEFVPPGSWAYVKDVTKYPYSPARAKEILDGADWKDHDGD